MKKYTFISDIPSSEITPEAMYHSRRRFIKLAGLAGAAAVLSACGVRQEEATPATVPDVSSMETGLVDELGDPANSFEDITNYNNYYEFTMVKEGVASMVDKLVTSPWQVEVSGLVQKPTTFDVEDILKRFPAEERVYRLRCVEGWSMVIPWGGFPLSKLLAEVEPMGSAKYVKFTSASIPDQMPGVASPFFPWPYTEGLRIDEAMNDLAVLVTELYGKPLPKQDGAPIRLVVPWKYGFKSAKALVKIELVENQPDTFWNTSAPNEYGFYSNVNPDVSHPRWSQATERRIGEAKRRRTLMFNGYTDQVASLYTGMDLAQNY